MFLKLEYIGNIKCCFDKYSKRLKGWPNVKLVNFGSNLKLSGDVDFVEDPSEILVCSHFAI